MRKQNLVTAILSVLAVLVLGPVGCQTIEEIEGDQAPSENIGGGFSDPAMNEGQRELDSNLCWQSIQSSSTSDEAVQQAYAECMAEKGYTTGP